MPTIIPDYQPPAGNPNVTSAIWLSDDFVVGPLEVIYGSGFDVLIGQNGIGRYDLTNQGTIWSVGVTAYSSYGAGLILNSGTIASVAASRQIVTIGINSRMDWLENSGTIYASTTKASAIAIWDWSGMGVGFGADPAITNSGTIAALSDETAIAVRRENGGTVTNLAGGEILAEGNWAFAIDIGRGRFNPDENDPVEVRNSGLIEASASGPDSYSVGIYATHLEFERLVIVNDGIIRADYAIYTYAGFTTLNDASETVKNLDGGLIEGLIRLGLGDDHVINDGQIVGDVDLGEGDDIYDGRGGQALGTIYGGSGNDTLMGGSENDDLDGGVGSDTANFKSSFGECTITFEGDVVIISAPGEATDRLVNFEYVSFGGDIRSVPSLSGANTPPVVTSEDLDFATFMNTSANFTVHASDFDRDILTYVAADPAHATVTGGAGGHFTYTPDNGYQGPDTVTVTVHDGHGGSAVQDYAVTVSEASPLLTDWTLLSPNGFAGSIGGSGKVFGTTGFQDVFVLDLPGTVVFDGSFNKGGDIVRLSADADNWQVKVQGSVALFSDGDTFAEIPVGPTGIAVVFDDGVRLMKIDTQAGVLKIGSQEIGGNYAVVNAPNDELLLPTGADDTVSAQLLLSHGVSVAVAGKLDIFGTAGQETVHLIGGDATFDGSFNKGGDRLLLDSPATEFMSSTVGSGVFLDSYDADVFMPTGINGMIVVFGESDERILVIDTLVDAIFLGPQEMSHIPVHLEAFA